MRGEAGVSEESTGGKGLGQKVEPTSKPGDGQSQQKPQPIVVNVQLPQGYRPQAQGSYRRGSGRGRPMTRGRGDVGRERIIRQAVSGMLWVSLARTHKSRVSYKSMARSTKGIFREPYCRPARGVIKSENEESIIECKMNEKVWNSRMDGWTARRDEEKK